MPNIETGQDLQKIYRATVGKVYRADCGDFAATDPGDTWITTESGSRILLDKDGNIKGGMGGKFNGQKMSDVVKTWKVDSEGKALNPAHEKPTPVPAPAESNKKNKDGKIHTLRRIDVARVNLNDLQGAFGIDASDAKGGHLSAKAMANAITENLADRPVVPGTKFSGAAFDKNAQWLNWGMKDRDGAGSDLLLVKPDGERAGMVIGKNGEREFKDSTVKTANFAQQMSEAILIYSSKEYSNFRKSPADMDVLDKGIDAVVEAGSGWKDGALFRGVSISKTEMNKFKVGTEFDQKGTSSWSSDPNVAGGFARHRATTETGQAAKGKQLVVFVENSTKNKRAMSIAEAAISPGQREVLYSGKAKFRVTKIEDSNTNLGSEADGTEKDVPIRFIHVEEF